MGRKGYEKFAIILALSLIFCTGILLGAETGKDFSIAIAGELKTLKASWSYGCPAGLAIHFKLYIKNGDQWQLIKEMDSYCTEEDQETEHFEELFECEIPALGQDYTFGMTAVNKEGTESDIVESTIHISLPKPKAPQNFEVEVQ